MIKKSPPIYVSLFLASFTSESGTCKYEDVLRPLYYRGDNISKEVIKQSLHPTFDIFSDDEGRTKYIFSNSS